MSDELSFTMPRWLCALGLQNKATMHQSFQESANAQSNKILNAPFCPVLTHDFWVQERIKNHNRRAGHVLCNSSGFARAKSVPTDAARGLFPNKLIKGLLRNKLIRGLLRNKLGKCRRETVVGSGSFSWEIEPELRKE